jgi:flavin-binding protein dodecin
MAIARITELTSSSTKSFDDALHEGIKRATKTLTNVSGAWRARVNVAPAGMVRTKITPIGHGLVRWRTEKRFRAGQ